MWCQALRICPTPDATVRLLLTAVMGFILAFMFLLSSQQVTAQNVVHEVASNIVDAQAATPEEILAVTVRMQGKSCAQPSSAKPVRDVVTKPGKRAWILTCESGQYLIKFVRDTTAQVTLIN